MRFVVLGYDAADVGPAGDAPGSAGTSGDAPAGASWAWLAPSSSATTVRDGHLTPGPHPATDPRLAAVCVLDASDLDAVTDAVRDLPGVYEVRPTEPR